jgi:hypothetical protein
VANVWPNWVEKTGKERVKSGRGAKPFYTDPRRENGISEEKCYAHLLEPLAVMGRLF